MVFEISCCGIWISVVRCWRVFGGVVEAHVRLRCCLPALVLNFKISKYFNTSSTYVRLVNAHNYAFAKKCLRANAEITVFTLDRIFVDAEISAFPKLHTAVIYVNTEIPAFTLGQIFVNAEISAFPNLNTSDIFVNADISAFTKSEYL